MGLWRMDSWEMNPQERLGLAEQLLELGVTTFDLADIYGDYQCEALFGEALQIDPSVRARMEIVSKCGIKLCGSRNDYRLNHYDSGEAHVRRSVESSLSNLGTDYLDLLLLHRPDPLMDAAELAAVLDDLVDTGKVRSVGVSNFLPHQVELLQSRLKAPLVVNQIEVSLLHSTPMFDGQLDHCQKEGILPMAWSPFAGGDLFTGGAEAAARVRGCMESLRGELGMDAQQIALSWLLRHPSRMVPVLGSGNLERLKGALAAADHEMPLEPWFMLLRAARGRDVD
ncbi:aldo/keto reductase [Microbulbifer guangxiensis]|uniref:aldo/keto reductase n=1 Tax=Microbulbifer guangxiensis TaxID=2904249 RepID=UPI0021030FF0|nr:aldo/keto reductase [Microbulbifer guangxiensis]